MPQVERIRWHLFPEIRVQQGRFDLGTEPAADEATVLDVAPDLVRVMDLQQEQLARSLGEGHRVIHGVAGSGKPLVLGYRAERLAQLMQKPVLVLCYNVALAAKLRHAIQAKGLDAQVTVRHFHGWCMDQLKLYHVALPPPAGEGGASTFVEALVTRVIDAVERGQIPRAQYGAVLIDEGHDFQPEWLKLVVQMVDPDTNAFLLLYDDAQSIYGRQLRRKFSLASVGIQAQGRTTILKLNYRNTNEVLAVAYEFAREVLTPEEADEDGIPLVAPTSAGRHDPVPELVHLPIAIVVMARFFPDYVGGPDSAGARESSDAVLLAVWEMVFKLLPIVALIVLVLGGIYGGIFTPTESAAVGALGSLILALVKRKLTWSTLWYVLVETGQITASICFLIIAATMYSRMLGVTGMPTELGNWVAGISASPWAVLAVFVVVLLILGTILDAASTLLIAVPLFVPVVSTFDANLVWFGIVAVIGAEIGILTPPLGLSVYVIKTTLNMDSVSLSDIFIGAFPFALVMMFVLILIILFPSLALVLI